MFRILGHLYVGSDSMAGSRSELESREITKLLSLEEAKVFAHHNILFRRVHVRDVPTVTARSQAIVNKSKAPLPPTQTPTNLFEVLPGALEFIDDGDTNPQGKTLIHCKRFAITFLSHLIIFV